MRGPGRDEIEKKWVLFNMATVSGNDQRSAFISLPLGRASDICRQERDSSGLNGPLQRGPVGAYFRRPMPDGKSVTAVPCRC